MRVPCPINVRIVPWLSKTDHVEEAGPSLLLIKTSLSEEVLLGVARDLGRGSRGHIVPRDASPIAFPHLL